MQSDRRLSSGANLNLHGLGKHHSLHPPDSVGSLSHPTSTLSEAFSVADPYEQLAGGFRTWGALGHMLSCPKVILVAEGLSFKCRLFHGLPGPAQAVANGRSLCSTYQVALG